MDGKGRCNNVKVRESSSSCLLVRSAGLVVRYRPELYTGGSQSKPPIALEMAEAAWWTPDTSYCSSRELAGRSRMSRAAVICQTCGPGMANSPRRDKLPRLKIESKRRPGRVLRLLTGLLPPANLDGWAGGS